METRDPGPRYSKPFYYDYGTKVYVDQDKTPTKLPNTNLLHGGRIGFNPNPDDFVGYEEDPSLQPQQRYASRPEKYKGTQFKDNLNFATLQSFKFEWNAFVLANNLSKEQQRSQLVSRGLAGNASLVVSQIFGAQLANADANEILCRLEAKICNSNMGVVGMMDMIKKVKQNTNEESLISFFSFT